MARRVHWRKYASRAHIRASQGTRLGPAHAKDGVRSRLSPSRYLDDPARGCDRADPDDLQPDETRIEPPRTNLPASTFDLIGRAGSMRELQDLLSGRRLVTLTGPGGIGKTALALEVARSQSSTFDGGVFFVELASLADSRLVPSAAATALGITFSGEEISGEAVARAIGGKKVFIVLDNCEHVVDAAANLAETLVRRCPHLTVLSTSREALRIEGEYLYHVPPLGVPPEHLRDF